MDVEKAAKKLAKAKEEVSRYNAILTEQKKKKENDDKMQSGVSLILCGFGLEQEDLHIGCMLYAMKAMEENPKFREQFRAAGAKTIAAAGSIKK